MLFYFLLLSRCVPGVVINITFKSSALFTVSKS
uniref:Uncharacterized protein n=1 Tax=Anguilla anguilla TaxID=7936 RepID=A0A0E9Y001_ANGAN